MSECGIYVHVPFCVSKCPYCAFVSYTSVERGREYTDAVVREIASRADYSLRCGTIHFGGGTPTVLGFRELKRILSAVLGSFRVAPGAEIAFEANPGTVNVESLRALKDAGFNRVSIGVQSFDDTDLRFLGRAHDASQARAAYDAAREAGFDNVGIDLIYGLPGRDAHHWEAQIVHATALRPEHVSCYSLTVEPGTRLAASVSMGAVKMPTEEEARELFLRTHRRMEELGYPAYEVSNFSQGGCHPSMHNSAYWTLDQYLGFGPAAHSNFGSRRSWNVRSLDEYSDMCVAGYEPVDGFEDLSDCQRAMEFVSLGLRTVSGVDLEELERRFSPGFASRNRMTMDGMTDDSLAIVEGGRLKLTLQGMLLADSLAASFDY